MGLHDAGESGEDVDGHDRGAEGRKEEASLFVAFSPVEPVEIATQQHYPGQQCAHRL